MSVLKLYKPKIQHYLIFLALLVVCTVVFQQFFVGYIVENFVISQFKPEKQELVNFAGVKGTPTNEGQNFSGSEVKSTYINKEYIFDFTSHERDEKTHGYSKAGSEWLVKAPPLGESAIILEPYGFWMLSFDFGFIVALLLTTIMPPQIGFMSQKFEREINNTKSKIRLQTGFNNEVVEVLTLRDADLEKLAQERPDYIRQIYKRVWVRTIPEEETAAKAAVASFDDAFEPDEDAVTFRNQILYGRIKEYFSEFVVRELDNVKNARDWQKNRLRIFSGLRLYMAHHFTEKYSNNVTGFAYGGAALLIIAVGVRGLKFIPATRPSLILFAILMEFTMLALLAFTLYYTEEEERMDKMLKKMEDASKNQLDSLNKLASDMHKMAVAFEGGTTEIMRKKVEDAVAEYLRSEDNVQSSVAKAIRDRIVVSLANNVS